MANKAQKLLAIIFALVTLTSTVVIAYSFNSYVGISLAVRSLSASVQNFDIELVDEGHMVITTNVVVNNTSPYEFYWVGLEQQVYVNDTYAGSVRAGDLTTKEPGTYISSINHEPHHRTLHRFPIQTRALRVAARSNCN
jgi:hypothetical protein